MNFELLSKDHDRTDFFSGLSDADDFLKTKAVKHQALGVSKTFAWCPDEDGKIGAYYSLSHFTLQRSSLSKPNAYPLYPLPCCKVCWLAVDERLQGRGVGSDALVVALRHSYNWLTLTSGVAAVLDAVDQRAFEWYLSKEFMRPIPGTDLSLIVSRAHLKGL